MNACLCVVELLSHVCSFLYDDKQHATLASLARTCRAFNEPALNYVWHDQSTLGHLVQCMPDNLWKSYTKGGKRFIKFVRGLEESDWARFDYHSRRIRRLGRTTPDIENLNGERDVHENVLSALGSYRSARELLPRLSTIIFDSESTIASPCAQSIFGISNTSVSFIGSHSPTHLPVLCSSLSRLSPSIREVRYCCSPDPPLAFFQLLLGLQDLHVVHLHGRHSFPRDVWEHFAALSSLRLLEGAWVQPVHALLMNKSPSSFMNLRIIDFSIDWKTGGVIMGLMHCRLESLGILVPPSDDPCAMSALQEFTKTISQHPCCHSLTIIRLFDDSLIVSDSTTSFSQALEPLFLCTELQEVELALPLHSLDDVWLQNAALAWNSLKILSLLATRKQTVNPGTNFSLTGLVPLAKHCPDLHTLYLSFHARAVHPNFLYGVCNRNVRSFMAGWESTILSPAQVTRSLITLFPNLKEILLEEDIADDAVWEEVNSWMKASAYNE